MGSALVRLAAVLVVCLALGATDAGAAELVQLDTHATGHERFAGPVTTAVPLAAGRPYFVTVTGTVSIWPPAQWAQPGRGCGAPEGVPLSPSWGVANGPVGWDAQTVFATPPGIHLPGLTCSPTTVPFHVPAHSLGGLQLDIGGGFSVVDPIGGARAVPRADHTYAYQVLGHGVPLAIRFEDKPTSDNYGVFTIAVLTPSECASLGCAANEGPSGDQRRSLYATAR